MKHFKAAVALISLVLSSMVHANDLQAVAPGLEKYAQDRLFGEVWKRPGLSPRDRSVVTLAALIARNQTAELPYYVNLALDHGVRPAGDRAPPLLDAVLLSNRQVSRPIYRGR